MKKRVKRLLILQAVVLLAVACGGGNETPPGAGPPGGLQVSEDLVSRISTTTDSILQAINVQRAEQGVPALITQPILADLALSRSADMAARSYLEHADPETGEIKIEKSLAGIGYSGPAAELLFAAEHPLESVPQQVVTAWFEAPMHKALLLEPSFRYCGIGIMGDGGSWKIAMVLTVSSPEEVAP
jgi:uncharacterized protein YkwD